MKLARAAAVIAIVAIAAGRSDAQTTAEEREA
jgi:hypothetical protein